MSNSMRKKFEDKIEEKWLDNLLPFLSSDEMKANFKALKGQKEFKIVYPDVSEVFNAFKYTPWDAVRVVIIGQVPYHDGSDHGIAYSSAGRDCPKQLKNIILEVENDCFNGLCIIRSILLRLEEWAKQGVLMFNTSLTINKGGKGDHTKLWEGFTKEVFRLLQSKPGTIYLLWGPHAQSYKKYIDLDQNHVLEAGPLCPEGEHPAGEVTEHSFKGCKHFTKVNEIITQQNGAEFCIDWSK